APHPELRKLPGSTRVATTRCPPHQIRELLRCVAIASGLWLLGAWLYRAWSLLTQNGHCAKSSDKEINHTSLEIVHRTGDLDCALRLHFGEHGTMLANVGYRNFHVLARDRVNKRIIFRRPLAFGRRGLYRGFNFRQQARQIAE